MAFETIGAVRDVLLERMPLECEGNIVLISINPMLMDHEDY